MVLPLLKGVPTEKEFRESQKKRKPLFLGVPLAAGRRNRLCQLRCIYCFVERNPRNGKELTLKNHMDIIDQFAEMGGRHVKTAHEGEPFLDWNFCDPRRNNPMGSKYPLVDHANSRGLHWTSFSNLLRLDPEKAEELASRDVSLIGKLNSLDPKTQEELTGDTGHYRESRWAEHNGVLIPRGLKYAIDAGFNQTEIEDGILFTRLGVDITVTSLNYMDIPDVVEFCVMNDIYPDIELLEISGCAAANSGLAITTSQNRWLYNQLRQIVGRAFLEEDRRMTNNLCPVFRTGIVYDVDGSLRYCYVVPMDSCFNLRKRRLVDVYDSLLIRKENRMDQIRKRFLTRPGMLSPCFNTRFPANGSDE